MIYTGTYLLHFMYVYRYAIKRRNQFDQKILPQDKYFSICLVRGKAFVKNCLDIALTPYEDHYFF